MRPALLALGLFACGDGPNAETVIDELRIVAAVADPPEVAVGETYDLTVVVADPVGDGADVLVWSCLPDGPCETFLAPLEGEEVHVPVLGVAPLPVWMLACAPGLCGDLEAVRPAQLADPSSWLAELPLSGVSAAARSTRIADGTRALRSANPELLEVPLDTPAGEADDVVPLTFVAPGATTAYGYATTGGFQRVQYDVASDGEVTLDWVGGPDAASGRVYVVLDDGEGGTAVWTADARTR